MRDPRLDGGPYFVPSELHRESDRFVERFQNRCPPKAKLFPTFNQATVIVNSI
jgi:hypothetical protein